MHYWHRVPLNAPQLPVVQLQKLNDFCSLVSQRCYTKVCWDARCSEKCVFFQEFLVFCDLFFASTVLYTTLIALIWLLRKSPTAIWRRGMGCRGLWKNTICRWRLSFWGFIYIQWHLLLSKNSQNIYSLFREFWKLLINSKFCL